MCSKLKLISKCLILRYSSQIVDKSDNWLKKGCTKAIFGLTYGLTRYDPGGLIKVRQVYHPMRN